MSRSGRAPGPVRTAVIALSGLLVVTALSAVAGPDPDRLNAPPPALAPVVSTTLVCPPLLGADGDVTSQLTVWSPPGLPGQEADGRAGVRPLGGRPGAAPNRTIDQPGEAFAVVTRTEDTPPIVIRGVGGLAPGLTGDVLTSSDRLEDRGISSVACAEPIADAWFVGGGSAIGRRSILFLSNADVTASTIDIDVYGVDGLIDSPAGRGVVVGAGKTRRIGLDALAPGAGALAVRVRASSGRVSSALRDGDRAGLRPRGGDYVPQAAAPTTQTIVPGLSGGDGTRELRILVPGDEDATVQVRILGRDEAFSPSGADVIEASAGALTTIDLTQAIDGEAVSLQLTSDQPITAGAIVRRTATRTFPDFAWTAATDPLDGLGGVATSQVGGGWDAYVMLTAGAVPASVDLRIGVPGQRLRTQRVDIPANRVRVVAVGRSDVPAFRGLLIVPRAGSGPVVAARLQQFDGDKGTTISTLPVRSLRVEVEVPDAAPDLSAGLGSAERR